MHRNNAHTPTGGGMHHQSCPSNRKLHTMRAARTVPPAQKLNSMATEAQQG